MGYTILLRIELIVLTGFAMAFYRGWAFSPLYSWQSSTNIRHTLTSPRFAHSNATAPDLISSTNSKLIKKIKHLQKSSKKRQQYSQVIVEGPRMIRDLYQNSASQPLFQTIVVEESLYQEYCDMVHSQDTAETPLVLAATAHVLKSCTDTVANQGAVALLDLPKQATTVSKLSNQQNKLRNDLYLILDGVSDPGNVGTLLRSAAATNVTAVILLPGCCDVWNPKTVRSSMGTAFWTPIFTTMSWMEAQEMLRECQCQHVYAATMLDGGKSQCHYDVRWNSSSAIIIGSEGNGLSGDVRGSLQRDKSFLQAIHVPMHTSVESLNAGVCGSVILFECLRQRSQQSSQPSP